MSQPDKQEMHRAELAEQQAPSLRSSKHEEPGEGRGLIREVGDMLKDTANTVLGPDGDLGGDQTRPPSSQNTEEGDG